MRVLGSMDATLLPNPKDDPAASFIGVESVHVDWRESVFAEHPGVPSRFFSLSSSQSSFKLRFDPIFLSASTQEDDNEGKWGVPYLYSQDSSLELTTPPAARPSQ
jgi:hypothetical protein